MKAHQNASVSTKFTSKDVSKIDFFNDVKIVQRNTLQQTMNVTYDQINSGMGSNIKTLNQTIYQEVTSNAIENNN